MSSGHKAALARGRAESATVRHYLEALETSKPKRGRKPIFEPAIFKERFRTIERVFAWEDKFRRLLLRFERISGLHYAFKTLAYTMINLRHYCQI